MREVEEEKMSGNTQKARICVMAIGLLSIPVGLAWAGGHTWDINEVFTDSTGTIQFVEIRETGGGANETAVNGHNITSTNPARSYLIPPPGRTPPTSFKTLLFATPAFVGLPGAPTPDYVFPAGSVPFINIVGAANTVSYTPFDAWTYGAGLLPTDGVHSLTRSLTTPCNSPTNYAGQTGTINVGCALLGDCDNSGVLDGGDVAAFVRAQLGTPDVGDKPVCSEYCQGSLAANTVAFVDDLLH